MRIVREKWYFFDDHNVVLAAWPRGAKIESSVVALVYVRQSRLDELWD